MKRISILLAIFLAVPLFVRAQDAATEEQLNKLRSDISTLQASNVELQKRLAETLKEVQELREQLARPQANNYANADDVKQLAEKIREVDRKRAEDRELILDEIKKLGRTVAASGTRPVKIPDDPSKGGDKPLGPEKGYEYVVQSGDTLSTIIAAYREKGVKVTLDQVLKANPGLKPESLKVGQKVFIPAPPK